MGGGTAHRPAGVFEAGDIDGSALAEALAETTQTLVCVLDREARIVLFNRACEVATGFSRAEVIGRDAREFVVPERDGRAFGAMLAEIWETGRPSPQVGHWRTRTGDEILVAWSNRPLLGEDGTPRYLVTAGLDITERERTAAELENLQAALKAKLAEVSRLAAEQAALRRVATLVAAEAPAERLFASVSEECAGVLGTGAAAVFRFEADGSAVIVGRYDGEHIEAFPLGSTVPLSPHTAIGRVYTTGEPAIIDDYTTLPGEVAEQMRNVGLRFTVAAPIAAAGTLWGAVAVTSTRLERPPPDSESRLRDFCELVSLAIASASAREDLRASRARIVQAADEERQRLERNLHDGAQQHLVSLAIALRLTRAKVLSDSAAAAALLDGGSRELEAAIAELRELARGLHPAILTERGLGPALEGLASRAPVPVTIAEVPDDRLPDAVEAAAYYVVSEAVTNVAKHARASAATVTITLNPSELQVDVCDDGRGGASLDAGSGLVGLRDRVEALGGRLIVQSPPGEGTVLRAALPLASP